jgi:MFS family permease
MGGAVVPQMSIVARWFAKRRGLMNGIAVAGMGIGTMLIPPVASWFVSSYGWSTSYVVIGFMVLAVVILAAQFLRRDPSQMGLIPYGSGELKKCDSDLRDQGFSFREAIRTKQFWLLGVAFFSFAVFLQAIMVHIVPHILELGISSTTTANIFIALGGLSILGRIVIGSAADKIGCNSAFIICFILTTTALAWLLVAKEMWMFYLFAAVFGVAYGGIVAVQSPSVAELFGLSSHGVILGANVFMSTLGAAIGPLLAGGIFDITGSYDWAFLASIIVSIFGLVSAVLLKLTQKT